MSLAVSEGNSVRNKVLKCRTLLRGCADISTLPSCSPGPGVWGTWAVLPPVLRRRSKSVNRVTKPPLAYNWGSISQSSCGWLRCHFHIPLEQPMLSDPPLECERCQTTQVRMLSCNLLGIVLVPGKGRH